MTYNVFGGTLNLTQPSAQLRVVSSDHVTKMVVTPFGFRKLSYYRQTDRQTDATELYITLLRGWSIIMYTFRSRQVVISEARTVTDCRRYRRTLLPVQCSVGR